MRERRAGDAGAAAHEEGEGVMTTAAAARPVDLLVRVVMDAGEDPADYDVAAAATYIADRGGVSPAAPRRWVWFVLDLFRVLTVTECRDLDGDRRLLVAPRRGRTEWTAIMDAPGRDSVLRAVEREGCRVVGWPPAGLPRVVVLP